jgi:hypothetical protein
MWKRSSVLDPLVSSRSDVEVAFLGDGTVAVRNSGDPTKVLHFSAAAWFAFVVGVKSGEFDLRSQSR